MLLITGTDTEVGKTFFTVSLLKFLLSKGKKACALKPVETGCREKCSDADAISRTCKRKIEPIYSFKLPLAPAVASEIEGKEINVELLKEKVTDFSKNYDQVLIEGAGGILVPITWEYSFLDLAKELKLDVIIVALNKLGVINHTLLTLKVCEMEGVKVKGIVLNSPKEFDESVRTNYETLKKLCNVPVFTFQNQEDVSKFAEQIL